MGSFTSVVIAETEAHGEESNIAGMEFEVVANKQYFFTFSGLVNSDIPDGIVLGINFPSGCKLSGQVVGNTTDRTESETDFINEINNVSEAPIILTELEKLFFCVTGYLKVTETGGIIELFATTGDAVVTFNSGCGGYCQEV